ncbi:2-oxo acid dehydrogenase subunit E2 [Buchnera aphidicola]|uniref:2-oxo acid dehydrogenase subunit E2 n=1 Tax=Buchnera aphidicola TaxID=9 RepID=UPI0031B6A20D
MNIKVYVPDIGLENVEVIEIFVKEGEIISKEKILLIVEGQKSSIEIPSPISGKVQKILVKIGDIVSCGTLIMLCKENKNSIVKNFFLKKNSEKFKNSVKIHNKKVKDISKNFFLNQEFFLKNLIYASPFIRRLAYLKDIDLSKIIGSGRNGRILKEDLIKFHNVQNFKNLNKKKIKNHKSDNNHISKLKNIYFLTSIQKASGYNLLKNWKNIPHVTQFDEVDITELENFRNSESLKNFKNIKNFKVTLLSFIIKVIGFVLKKFPLFNSSLDLSNHSVILHNNINIGIAMESSEGLLVPVLKDIPNKNIFEIAKLLKKFSNKVQKKKISILDMKDGTFTISSLGNLGGTGFTPIIKSPEVGILGISKAQIKPIWITSKFVPRLILPFSMSYDHRVIDGANAVRFMVFFKKCLTDIRLLLL